MSRLCYMSEKSPIRHSLTDYPSDRVLIAPSVLACDWAHFGDEVQAVTQAGAEVLHLDIMDGHFVPNISFGMDVVKSVRKLSDMVFDVHLMITDPRKYIPRFVAAGADHITFHVEVWDDVDELLDFIHAQGCTAGLSLRPATPIEAVLPYLEKLDMLLVMTVEPGFGGQSFHGEQLSRILKLHHFIGQTGKKIHLEVDGGIAEDTAELVRSCGANVLVAGSSVFRAKGDYRNAIDCLR